MLSFSMMRVMQRGIVSSRILMRNPPPGIQSFLYVHAALKYLQKALARQKNVTTRRVMEPSQSSLTAQLINQCQK